MTYLAACLVTIAAIEVFLRLPVRRLTVQLIAPLKKTTKVITSHAISDHWKEKVLPIYAGKIAFASLKIAIVIGGVLLVVVLLSKILDHFLSLRVSTIDTLSSWIGITVVMVFSAVYLALRKRLVR